MLLLWKYEELVYESVFRKTTTTSHSMWWCSFDLSARRFVLLASVHVCRCARQRARSPVLPMDLRTHQNASASASRGVHHDRITFLQLVAICLVQPITPRASILRPGQISAHKTLDYHTKRWISQISETDFSSFFSLFITVIVVVQFSVPVSIFRCAFAVAISVKYFDHTALWIKIYWKKQRNQQEYTS